MTFSSSFGRVFSPTFQPKSQAKAGGDWWLAGGVNPTNCVAAYQAKGAASLTASKVNMANPSTYNLIEMNTVSWDAINGWNGNGSGYFKTGITGANAVAWSMIIRFSNGGYYGDSMAWGTITIGKRWAININMGTFARVYIGNMFDVAGAQMTSGIYSLAGDKLYENGSLIAQSNNEISTVCDELGVLGYNNGGTFTAINITKVQAIAFYNTVLTSTQIGLLTTAMESL